MKVAIGLAVSSVFLTGILLGTSVHSSDESRLDSLDQVKLFTKMVGNDAGDIGDEPKRLLELEKEMNNWLQENKDRVEVVRVATSANGPFRINVVVHYRTK